MWRLAEQSLNHESDLSIVAHFLNRWFKKSTQSISPNISVYACMEKNPRFLLWHYLGRYSMHSWGNCSFRGLNTLKSTLKVHFFVLMFVSNPKYLANLYLKSTDFLFLCFKSTYFQINVYPKLEIWDNSIKEL